MQVDPIKPTLKALRIKLLKLKYDKPLSIFAFNFNLRRHNLDASGSRPNSRVLAMLRDFNGDGVDELTEMMGRGLRSLTSELNLRTFDTR